MAPTHGFTIKIQNADGKTDTACFSSARKTPSMLGILKDIAKRQRAFEKVQARIIVARQRLAACANVANEIGDDLSEDTKFDIVMAKLDKAQEQLDGYIEEQDELNAALCDLMWQFYKGGFIGAGYTEEQAEQFAATCDPTDFPMIRDRCMTGCGVVDFTKRDTF